MKTVSEPGIIDALGEATTYGEELILHTVRDTHRAWAGRSYRLLNRVTGNRARGAQLAHDQISSMVYGAIGIGLSTTGTAFRAAGSLGAGPRLDDGPRGRFVRSALNGLVGDRFAREGSRLAIRMGVRRHGADVPLTPEQVAQVFPEATGRIVVFLHGLSESEAAFDLHRNRVGSTYPETVADLGWTPVMLRANTGLSVRANGVELATLLRDLVAAWPVEVTRIALVGHSMGGLIMRAACAVAAGDTSAGTAQWSRLVTDVVTLGTPHRGAPLAVGVGHGSRWLARLPETSAFGRILDQRSVGITDLVEGLGEEVTALPHARYRLVAATLGGSERNPVGHLVGDLLVRVPSAHGRRGPSDLFPDAEELHVPRSNHFGLLNHPDVHARMREWLD